MGVTKMELEEALVEYINLKKCVNEHGELMLTAIKKDQQELAYNCYFNIIYIEKVLTSTCSPLKNDILLQDELVKLCEHYAKQYPSDYPQLKRDTHKKSNTKSDITGTNFNNDPVGAGQT
jgi:hypothetical protein